MAENPPLEVGTREELVALLHEAAELEHGLACSYLFAAFSIKPGTAEGITSEQAESLERWRTVIVEVALEEMLHLALVSNLLTALGAAPHLRRPPFPQRSRYYPAGVRIELLGFNEATLTRFVDLERPEGVDAELDGVTGVPAPGAAPGALIAPEEMEGTTQSLELSTVGDLYHAIDSALCALVAAKGEDLVFIGAPMAQAASEYFDLHQLVAVTDLATARQALQVLVEQGEGVRGDWAEAHYGKFRSIREELRSLLRGDPGFAPAWSVLANPLAEEPVDGAADRVVTDVGARAVMTLFNRAYGLMTAMLMRFFAHTDETEAQLNVLAAGCVELMVEVIKPLGALLATMPAGAPHDGAAGASFEYHRSVALVPHRRAAWMIYHEQLVELAGFTQHLSVEGGSGVISDVEGSLTEIASRIAAGMGA